MLGLLVEVAERLQLELLPAVLAAQLPLLLLIRRGLLGALQQLLLDPHRLLAAVSRPLAGRFLGRVSFRRGDWLVGLFFWLLIGRLLVRGLVSAFKCGKLKLRNKCMLKTDIYNKILILLLLFNYILLLINKCMLNLKQIFTTKYYFFRFSFFILLLISTPVFGTQY